jgi:hypothetical protein
MPGPRTPVDSGCLVARIAAVFRRHRPPLDPFFDRELLLWHAMICDVRAVLSENDKNLEAGRIAAASGWVPEETLRELLAKADLT